jgi:hypothetical protein
MRKSKKKEGNKNLHLGFYFGFVVLLIILVSIIFKIFDTVRRSEFDGNNLFTVAVISGNNTNIISVSPKESTLKRLTIKGLNTQKELNTAGIPYDNLAEANENNSAATRSYFTKIIFHKDGFKSNLTILDLLKLSVYSQKTDGAGITEEEVDSSDQTELDSLTSKWFQDPQILKENQNIEITNTTNTSGLGNRIAKQITNMGGNVVLVNSSPAPVKNSKIYYKTESYTLEKLSNILEIPIEKKEVNALSDIVIEIGEDKENF